MEENYDLEEINIRRQRLVDRIQENIYEFAGATDEDEVIINIHVREFSWQAGEFESIYALKLVLEGVLDDYEMDTEDVMYKINELMGESVSSSIPQSGFGLNSENVGYIYLMINPSMSGISKIGLTRRTPEERLEELSKATGVPTPFILVYKEQFNDCVSAEKMIHAILEERGERVSSNREFFNTETSEAIKVIQQVKQNDEFNSDYYVEESYELYDDKPISKEYLEKGIDYLNGFGDYLQDYDRAIEYLEKSGELGEAQAYHELGNLHIDIMREDEFTLDVKKAIRYFEKGKVLKGKYANYCNAGLALCYANRYFEYSKIKNYTQNDANAEKCWDWFFDNLDFNNSDYLAGSYIVDCCNHFLVNEECSSVYQKNLEPIALSVMKKCRYDIYDTVSDSLIWKEIKRYLLNHFEESQLDRQATIKWLPSNELYDADGINFEILIEKGSLVSTDYLSFSGYGGAYRTINSLMKDGQEVSIINEGEQGIVKVSCILEDFQGFLSDNLSIKVIGNDILEEKNETVFSEELAEKGLFRKMKSWFN